MGPHLAGAYHQYCDHQSIGHLKIQHIHQEWCFIIQIFEEESYLPSITFSLKLQPLLNVHMDTTYNTCQHSFSSSPIVNSKKNRVSGIYLQGKIAPKLCMKWRHTKITGFLGRVGVDVVDQVCDYFFKMSVLGNILYSSTCHNLGLSI